ncbi:MAG: winged helix-turn-helix domain-containing protein [Candidatus Heimdallarchaeaceae archaeon]
MLEVKDTAKQNIHSSLTATIIAVIESSSHKLTCGEIVNAIKQLYPDCNKSSIRRILTRLTKSSKYSIARTETRPYLYYYFKPKQPEQIPYELDSFFDSDEPLFIHRIMIMIRDVLIKKDEKLELPFLGLNNPIRFSFYKTTQSIRIDLKCSGWKKALDCNQFSALIAAIDTALHLKNVKCTHNKMQIINLDLNQDFDFQRIAGANYISVQAFENLLLTAYNKKEGLRKEAQLSLMTIPVDRMLKQLKRNERDLGIGTVFNKMNTILKQFTLSSNQSFSKLNSVLDYNRNVVQQLDSAYYETHNLLRSINTTVNQLAQYQLQTATNDLMLLQRMDYQAELILNHDTNMKKESEFLAEEIQLLKVIRTNQARSDSLQTEILELLKEKSYTLQDFMTALQLDYNRIYYHIRKLLDLGKITATKEERKGKGARKRIYKLKVKR